MFLKDTLLYILSDSLHIYNIANPVSPNQISKTFLQYTVADDYDIVNQGDTLYWGNYKLGISNISNINSVKSNVILQDTRQIGNTLDVKGDIIYAGASLQGVWFFKINRITDVKTIENNFPNAFQLFQNYPNPFNPTTVISYQLPAASNITLRVYNVLGQEVFEKDSGFENAGIHKMSLDMSNYASGIYFYSINAVSADGKRFVSTKKMVLLK